MSKKILHIGKYYPPFMGGIETFMAALLPQLSKMDFSICALVHHHLKAEKLEKVDIEGVQVIRAPCYGRLFFAPISPTFPYYLKKTLKNDPPDLIHIHMPNTSAFWLLFNKQAKKIPWIIHWHSDVITSQRFQVLSILYLLYKPFEQALLKRSSQVICTSPIYMKSSPALKDWQHKCCVIPLGINPIKNEGNIQASESTVHWFSGKKRVLAIGRLTYYKGFCYLIEAMQHLPDCQLIIVGQGELFSKLQQQIQSLQLQENIQLVGHLDNHDLDVLKQSCDLFCLPSIERTEAFGMVLLEMMLQEKPIVVSQVEGSGMNWVVKDKHSALLVKNKNANDLASKIKKILSEADLAQQLTKNAKQRLLKKFTISSIAEKTQKLYHQVLSTTSD